MAMASNGIDGGGGAAADRRHANDVKGATGRASE